MFHKSTFVEIFKYYFPISLVSFGGPQAHIAMFHDQFVDKLNWLSDATFTELFAVTQALPGN
jgi:chromate transporter